MNLDIDFGQNGPNFGPIVPTKCRIYRGYSYPLLFYTVYKRYFSRLNTPYLYT